jgi:uncharacterized protein (DUF1778 family)
MCGAFAIQYLLEYNQSRGINMGKRDIDKKTTAIQIRVSIIEKSLIEQHASERGLSLAEFIRQQVLYPSREVVEDFRIKLAEEIRRQVQVEYEAKLEIGIRERIKNMSLGSLFFNRRDFRRWERDHKALPENVQSVGDKR